MQKQMRNQQVHFRRVLESTTKHSLVARLRAPPRGHARAEREQGRSLPNAPNLAPPISFNPAILNLAPSPFTLPLAAARRECPRAARRKKVVGGRSACTFYFARLRARPLKRGEDTVALERQHDQFARRLCLASNCCRIWNPRPGGADSH